ncbi:DUF4190 domain-containing protein [Isoptericola cucumis]|nr:DUF4190 domain-containing protein [Isoptericola cucumis]
MDQGDGFRGTGATDGWNPYEPVADDQGGSTTPPGQAHGPATSTVAEPYTGYTTQETSPYAQSPYAQSPYAQSPYPAAAPAPQGTDGVSIAALVTGILGLALVPLVLGIVGVSRTTRSQRPGKGLAIAGIVLGALSTVGWLIGVLVLVATFGALEQQGVLDDLSSEISQGTAQSYGDDATLDGLYDSCEGGDDLACDELYWESAPGSEYEDFALTCGGRGDRCLFDVGED